MNIYCQCCDSKDYYMVHVHLWASCCLDFEYLCIECFEKRLGRKLTKKDFTKYPINDPTWREMVGFEMTPIHKDRLGVS